MSIRRGGVVLGGSPSIDSALSNVSTNPVQNKVITGELNKVKPIIQTTAPTSADVGVIGQLWVNTSTSKTYHCTGITSDQSDPSVLIYEWTDDINAKGGTFTQTVYVTTHNARFVHGSDNTVSGDYSAAIGAVSCSVIGYHTLVTGNSNTVSGNRAFVAGVGNRNNSGMQFVHGKYNEQKAGARIVGGGSTTNDRLNIEELSWNGDHYIAGGHQQGNTVIPAATSSYTLTEGVQSHVPDAAPTYTLPTITDATRTHEIILNVKFSATALSYSFQDASGNTLSPYPLIIPVAGQTLCFLCEYDSIGSKWNIMTIDMGGSQ